MLFSNLLSPLKRPGIYYFGYLDFIIEDKPLLLLSWRSKKEYRVFIKELNRSYHQKELSVILKLPSNVNQITISFSTFWRKRKFRVNLHKVKLDEETSRLLAHSLKPYRMPEILMSDFVPRKPPPLLRKLSPGIKIKWPSLIPFKIRIQRCSPLFNDKNFL